MKTDNPYRGHVPDKFIPDDKYHVHDMEATQYGMKDKYEISVVREYLFDQGFTLVPVSDLLRKRFLLGSSWIRVSRCVFVFNCFNRINRFNYIRIAFSMDSCSVRFRYLAMVTA